MQNKNHKTLILMSGGIDSAACVHFCMNQGFKVSGVFINYGQKAANHERDSVIKLSKHYSIPFQEISVQSTANKISIGEISGRNAFLIFSALTLTGFEEGLICIGVHSGTPYFDCSPAFIDDVNKIVEGYSDGKIRLFAPFVRWGKADVMEYCSKKSLPLDLTYSCEIGLEGGCEECPSCHERRSFLC